jgi:hypothetical protein
MRAIGIAVFGYLLSSWSTVAVPPTLSLTITTLETNAKVGQVVLVRVITVNESNQPVTYYNTSTYCNYSLKVLTSAGTPAPATDFKKGQSCGSGQLEITGRRILVMLKPGESSAEDIRISEQYDLSQPGQYSIQVDRTFPGIGNFSSNVVNVSVTP